ncbi:unnamed protein product, partial [Amoebophrya sp. A25]
EHQEGAASCVLTGDTIHTFADAPSSKKRRVLLSPTSSSSTAPQNLSASLVSATTQQTDWVSANTSKTGSGAGDVARASSTTSIAQPMAAPKRRIYVVDGGNLLKDHRKQAEPWARRDMSVEPWNLYYL